MKTIVPDYYKSFRCKCGECRHTCCSGWGITISYPEYCRLLGINCSAKLRKILDCAFFVLPDADYDRYAEVKPNYLGSCPLQSENGLCALQCECGEKVLPEVCRTYPRNVGLHFCEDTACANSCEKVVEMLLAETDGLTLVETELPDGNYLSIDEESEKIGRAALEFLRDRKFTLAERLVNLGKYIDKTAMEQNIEEEIFGVLVELVRAIESFSDNFAAYSIIAEEDLGLTEAPFDPKAIKLRFEKAEKTFVNRYPLCEIYFENILINHILFTRFPSSNRGETVFDKYAELCAVYALTRFAAVAYTENNPSEHALADCIAGLFRCFEHSNADGIIKSTLKRMGALTPSYLFSLVREI